MLLSKSSIVLECNHPIHNKSGLQSLEVDILCFYYAKPFAIYKLLQQLIDFSAETTRKLEIL